MGVTRSLDSSRGVGASVMVAGASRHLSMTKGRGCVEVVSLALLESMRGNLLLTKAVAMSIYVKNRTRDSRVKDYTPNRLRQLTRLHYNTVCKYMRELAVWGLVRMEGSDMVFGSLSNRHGKNISIGPTAGLAIKQLTNQLLAAQVVLIVKRKEYVKQLIDEATDPKRSRSKEEFARFKKARKKRLKYGYTRPFVDNGLSYKGIARRLGISVQKAEEVIRYATAHGLLVKHTHQQQHRVDGIGAMEKFIDEAGCGMRNFTFSTKDNVYIILANTYSLPPSQTGIN